MSAQINKVCVVGLGYIGLPTAAILASRGIEVYGLEVNPAVVESINRGEIHIVEPGLDAVVRSAVSSGKLRAGLNAEPCDAYMVAVPTPFKEGFKPDLSYIQAAAKKISKVLKKGDLVVLESTSPVGATDLVADWIATERPDLRENGVDFLNFAYCPERVLPGHILKELVENDRIIGGRTEEAAKIASDLYRIFVVGQCLLTDARTAEMAKLTENSFRDVNIAFANELSIICDKLNINVWELISLANRHPRVNILQPGPGVGGHCIAVDPWFIVDSTPEEARLIRTARQVNDSKPHFVIEKVKQAAARFKSPTIVCLGLAFKANIDDLRESPSLEIVNHLADLGVGSILAVEPNIVELPSNVSKKVSLVSIEQGLSDADIIVLLVDHREFQFVDREKLANCVVIDTRGFFLAKRV